MTKMFGLNNKFKKLDQFAHAGTLTAAQKSEVKKILAAAGINFEDEETAANEIKSKLYEATEGKNIYVYMEEGEDPTGKRCVYADEAGNPTEENVSDGEHKCKDGSMLMTSTKEDGMSYVDSFAPAQATPEPAPAPEATPPAQQTLTLEAIGQLIETKLAGVKTELLAAVDGKITTLKSEIVVGKTPGPGVNNLGGNIEPPVESAFDRRRKEIREKNQNQK